MARRAEALSSFPVLSVALMLLAFTLGGTVKLVQGQKTWCVAKPSLDEATLLLNINYACSQVDCSVLRKGSPCFNPDNLISHASVSMNLYYQSKGPKFLELQLQEHRTHCHD
ncbi:major pollen allergen Ole e 10-like [Dioscorea cayenensis subsp. rotundata]|uniref:Major pollen allergen Ole e 10-like n=1 Tax=Dioscorea cayennensis subsp. rotundata TaxID=55577 RepID=A0AB40BCS4_DIOCR|nr:major pollen allergen Ole e 10-like [Dioscorea cayenensis subsp. rotundata]